MRWFALPLALTLAFLVVPVLAIFLDSPPRELLDALGEPGALDALWLSLRTSVTALAIIVVIGTPAAYLLATRRFRGRSLVITLIELPLVLPPAVAGIALLAAVGPSGILGGALEDAGVQLVFETAGVVVALTFVASPYYLRQAQASFAALDRSWLDASRTLGASPVRTFARVAIPTALPGLATGGALAFGRALGEFLVTQPGAASGHLAVLRMPTVEAGAAVRLQLEKDGVEWGLHYRVPEELKARCPRAWDLSRRVVSLPCHLNLSPMAVESIVKTVKKVLP